MKFFMCVLVVGAACAAPAPEEGARDKRGIFGEPGGLLSPHLHHDALLGTHLHAPALHAAPVLHAPLRAPLIASSGLHHHDLHDHALLHDLHHHDLHHAPIITSHAHAHAPIISSHAHAPIIHHDLHHDLLHHDIHHDIHHHAPLVLSHPPVLRVRTIHAPSRHIIRGGW